MTALVQQAAGVSEVFQSCHESAELLTPYAVPFRYPGDVAEPDRCAYYVALRAARLVFHLVWQLLPKAVRPE